MKIQARRLQHYNYIIRSFSIISIWVTFFLFYIMFSTNMLAQTSAGNALSVDGVDDFAYPLTPNAAGLSEGTVELWFSTDGMYSSLWCGGNGLPGVTGDWTRFGTHSSVGGNYLAFGIYAGGWRWASTGTVPDSGTWYHTAATWGPTGMKIYLNGSLAGQNGHTGGLHSYVTELVTASAWGIEFSGEIDELRIWNIARDSLAIVSTLYDTLGSEYYATLDSGLIAYYRMDAFEDLGINSDGSDDLRDLSANANHLDSEGNPFLNTSGAFVIATGISDQLIEMPNTISLNQNYPNPFNPSTTISFILPKSFNVEINIYNALGKKVKTLYNSIMEAGRNNLSWNGMNDFNQKVSSGVYFYTLKTKSLDGGKEFFSKSSKMLLLR